MQSYIMLLYSLVRILQRDTQWLIFVMSKPNLYFVYGGLGKQIAFTAIINGLYEQEKNKICIGSSLYPVFKYHPKVVRQFLYDNSFLTDTSHYHYKKYKNIICGEPYNSNFLKGDTHLIDSYAELYGVKEYKKEPDLYKYIELFSVKHISGFGVLPLKP